MKITILFTGLILLTQNLFGQCSDAGVCSLGNLKSITSPQKMHQFGLDYIFAYSGKEEEISYHTIQLSTAFELFENSTIMVKLPFYASLDGALGNVNGVGDLIVSVNQRIYSSPQNSLYFQIGSKLATGDANKDGSLPMAYQTGLGTNDLLFGVSYSHADWNFSAGYQLAENNRNDNDLTRLKRGDDIYLKAAYQIDFDNYSLVPEILLIKRLQKSSTIDPVLNEAVTEKDSDPLQINIGSVLSYNLNPQINVNIRIALAMLKRKNNVDGLTRGFTLGIGSAVNF